MSVWEGLATVVVAWALALGTCWFVFVAVLRVRTLKEIAARKRRALEQAEHYQATMLGAMSEGTGRVPGDAEDAAAEHRARRRMTRGL